MSRPLTFAVLGLAVIGGVAGLFWAVSSSEQTVPETPTATVPQAPQRVVSAAQPAPVAPEPRSSASFAPMPEGIDMRRLRPHIRDAEAVRRLQQRAVDAGLTVEARGMPELVEDEAIGWTVDREGIESAIGELRGEMHDCMDGYGPEVGAYDGRVILEFDISADAVEDGVAYPQDLLVTGTDVPQAIQSCMASVYSNLTFEPPADGVTRVEYPIQLVSDDE